MITTTETKGLEPLVKDRILRLLQIPYAGSRTFKVNHRDAEYLSNCHGTTAYVYGLKDPIIKQSTHPHMILEPHMNEIIKRHFAFSNTYDIGNLICFYTLEENYKSLIHTALLVEPDGQIFHQSGSGGIFEIKTVEKEMGVLFSSGTREIDIIKYKLRA